MIASSHCVNLTFEQFDGYRETYGLPELGAELGVPKGGTDCAFEDQTKGTLSQVVLHYNIVGGNLRVQKNNRETT